MEEKHIKEILKEERKKLNLTQEQLAKQLGIARSTYAKYETGENIPTIQTLANLADIYDKPIDYLVGRYIIRTKNDPRY